MHPKYPHLFSPIKIGNLTIKNRIESAPVGTPYGAKGLSTIENLISYETRARSGAGLIVRGEMVVCRMGDEGDGPEFDRTAEAIQEVHKQSEAVHRYGGISSVSLAHHGGWNTLGVAPDGKLYAPSRIPNPYNIMTTEMTEDDIYRLAEAYGHAAEVAEFGGHDMVQIHGAHGWILSQFLSPNQNKRTDKYGGSLENRARFPLMVIEEIKKRCPNLPIEYRFSADEHVQGGFGPEEAVEFARMLDGKVDLIHVTSSTFWDPSCGLLFPSMFDPTGVNIPIAQRIKEAVHTPVVTVGKISDLVQAEEAIASGKIDMVAAGRAFMADPDWVNKVYHGHEEDVAPCLRCGACLPGAYGPAKYYKFHAHTPQCTVNPEFGREWEKSIVKPGPKQKVLIVGGGPGGLQAAITAHDRGHEVVLCEKTDKLGGMVNVFSKASFKKEYRTYIDRQIRWVKERDIDVRLNTEVTLDYAKAENADVLIAAIGAEPIIPPVPGADGPNVHPISDVDEKTLGKSVVVIGGGPSGAEEALYLAEQGHSVTVIEKRDRLALGAPYLQYIAVNKEYEKAGAPSVYLESEVIKITEDGVTIKDKQGKNIAIKADAVLLAIGMKAREAEAEGLRDGALEFRKIGDCKRAATVEAATRLAWDVAYGL